MSYSRYVAVVAALGLTCTVLLGQPKPPVPPPLPAINPALARLDTTVGGLTGPGLALTYADDAGLLIAACEDQSLCYWHKDVVLGLRGSEHLPHQVKAHQGPILTVVSAAGVTASGGTDGKILLWSLPAEKILHTLNVGSVVRSLSFSPDGKTLASAGDDNTVHIWDAVLGKAGPNLAGSTDWLLAVAYSPDGKTVAAGGFDGKLHVWEAATGKKLLAAPMLAPAVANQPAPEASAVCSVAFSPDSKTIAVGGLDAQIYLFQSADGKFLRVIPGHTSSITALAFHPSGTVLVSASKDRSVRLWNPATGQLLKALEGHNAWVQGVTFLTQGTRLASVSADHTVRVWDLAEPGKK